MTVAIISHAYGRAERFPMPRSKPPAAIKPEELFFDKKHAGDFQHTLKFIETVETLRRIVAPVVAANGVDQGDDYVWSTVELLGEMDTLTKIQNLGDRLERADVDATVPCPLDIDPNHRDRLEDAAVTMGVAFGRAGYLLGLAVGMQLGPNALTGGTR